MSEAGNVKAWLLICRIMVSRWPYYNEISSKEVKAIRDTPQLSNLAKFPCCSLYFFPVFIVEFCVVLPGSP